MALEYSTLSGIISSIISILIVSVFIHFGAKPFAKEIDEKFSNAIIVAVVGAILAGLVSILLTRVVSGLVATLIGIAVWALVAGAVYHVSWFKGLLIGIVAGLLWFLVNLVLAAIGL